MIERLILTMKVALRHGRAGFDRDKHLLTLEI